MRWQSTSETPTITRPDLDRDQDVKPKALRPYKVVVLDCSCHTFDDVEIALCRVIPGMTRPCLLYTSDAADE